MDSSTLESANTALGDARRRRAEWLMWLHEEMFGVGDLLREASSPGDPLRRLTIAQMLTALPGWGDASADKVVRGLIDACVRVPRRAPTVGWLLSNRERVELFMLLFDKFEPVTARKSG